MEWLLGVTSRDVDEESDIREAESAVDGRSWRAEFLRAAGFFLGGTASGQVHCVEWRVSLQARVASLFHTSRCPCVHLWHLGFVSSHCAKRVRLPHDHRAVGGGTNLYFLSSAGQTAGLAPGVFWTLALRLLGPHLGRDQVYMAGEVGRVLRMRR